MLGRYTGNPVGWLLFASSGPLQISAVLDPSSFVWWPKISIPGTQHKIKPYKLQRPGLVSGERHLASPSGLRRTAPWLPGRWAAFFWPSVRGRTPTSRSQAHVRRAVPAPYGTQGAWNPASSCLRAQPDAPRLRLTAMAMSPGFCAVSGSKLRAHGPSSRLEDRA